MPYPPAPPPEDSGNSLDWNSAADLLRALSEQSESQRGARFQEVFQLLRPWIDSAVESLCRRHCLLLDSSATSFALVQGLTGASATTLGNSAKSEVVFQIALQSLALKSVKDETAAWQGESEAHDAGSWNQFRVQLNSMLQEERATILAALPPITLAQDREAAPVIPTAEWLSLWSAATQGIEVTALPLEWQRYLEAPPTAVYDKSCESPTIWIPSKNSGFEQELGKELFKASVWTAKEKEDKLELFVPKWVGDSNRLSSTQNIRTLIQENGRMPDDPKLEALIRSLLTDSTPTHKLPTVTELLGLSSDLGFSRFTIETHHAVYLREIGDAPGSLLSIQRALNHCQSHKNMSNGLSTLAGFMILDGHLDEALRLAEQAVILAPWSPLAKKNVALAQRLFDAWNDATKESKHG